MVRLLLLYMTKWKKLFAVKDCAKKQYTFKFLLFNFLFLFYFILFILFFYLFYLIYFIYFI